MTRAKEETLEMIVGNEPKILKRNDRQEETAGYQTEDRDLDTRKEHTAEDGMKKVEENERAFDPAEEMDENRQRHRIQVDLETGLDPADLQIRHRTSPDEAMVEIEAPIITENHEPHHAHFDHGEFDPQPIDADEDGEDEANQK